MKIILTHLPKVRVFLIMQILGNGNWLLLENMMNLHIIYETGCATSKYCIINFKFDGMRWPTTIALSAIVRSSRTLWQSLFRLPFWEQRFFFTRNILINSDTLLVIAAGHLFELNRCKLSRSFCQMSCTKFLALPGSLSIFVMLPFFNSPKKPLLAFEKGWKSWKSFLTICDRSWRALLRRRDLFFGRQKLDWVIASGISPILSFSGI